ncbi:phage polarity suppression protein, partial [Salmonella enterica]
MQPATAQSWPAALAPDARLGIKNQPAMIKNRAL